MLAVFLDFQRAFETIDRSILLRKLERYGIRGVELAWFASFLKGRTQLVKIGKVKSRPLANELGVPQGSILGVLLFLLYINDISDCLEFCDIKMFADDTLIYMKTIDVNEGVIKLNSDLSKLFDKINQNKLKLNVEKTKMIVVSKKKNLIKENIVVNIDGKRIVVEDRMKYLGVIIDENMSFKPNFENVCAKMARKVGVLARIGNQLNLQQKIMVYKTIIEPHICYCATVLFLNSDSDLERLQRIQNKCIRTIFKLDKYTSKEMLLQVSGLFSVKQTVEFNTLVAVHKIVHKLWPSYLSSRIKHKSENETKNKLRSKNEIEKTNTLKSYSQNSIFYKGIELYNKLTKELKTESNIGKFKNGLKKCIVNM